MLNFTVGKKYSRRDVQIAAGCPDAGGGPWYTGVVTPAVAGDFIVFATVGDEGRTGHDYPNRWEGSRLRWYHQKNARIDNQRVQGMLDGSTPVHVFWRSSNKDRFFTYAGLARAQEVKSSPVEILWSF